MKKRLKRFGLILSVFSLISVVAIVYAYFIEPDRIVVKNETIEIKGWKKEFDDLRIVAISDIHGGSHYITEEKIQKIVNLVNKQDADIVVILGDFVSQVREDKPIQARKLKMPIETIADNLKGLKAKYGVYAVLGNHDVWYNEEKVYDALKNVGLNVLNNEVEFIEKNGEKLRIFGLKDHIKVTNWETFSDEAKKDLEKYELSGDVIVLEHSPDLIKIITDKYSISNDLKLFIAGHTHGGQVWFPIIGSPIVPSSYGQTYSQGHMKEGDLDMFVTSGIGTSILPLRFFVPPEIAVLTIKSK